MRLVQAVVQASVFTFGAVNANAQLPGKSIPWPGKVKCSDTITMSAKLTENLDCNCDDGPAVIVDGVGTVFDLNGHIVSCGNETYVDSDSQLVGIKLVGKSNVISGPGSVEDTSTGIVLAGEGGHCVSRVSVLNSADQGIRIAESDGNTIDKSFIKNAGNTGVAVYGRNNVITKNNIKYVGDCECNGDAVEVGGGRGNVVEENIISEAINGVAFGATVGNSFLRNFVTDVDCNFVLIEGSSAIRVEENILVHAESCSGVYISGGLHISVINNEISQSDVHGVEIVGNSEKVVLQSNTISRSFSRAIDCFSSDDSKFIGNTIQGTLDGGVRIRENCDYTMIRDNLVTRTAGGFSLSITGGDSCTAQGNAFQTGVNGAGSGTFNHVFDNAFLSGGFEEDTNVEDDEDADDREQQAFHEGRVSRIEKYSNSMFD